MYVASWMIATSAVIAVVLAEDGLPIADDDSQQTGSVDNNGSWPSDWDTIGASRSPDEDSNDGQSTTVQKPVAGQVDIVTRFLQIVESQHLLGANCTAGTDLNLGEGVVDRYAQDRFRVEAEVAVNRANMLTR